MKQTLIVPVELPALNETIAASKKHWSHYSSMKRDYTNLIAAMARKQLKPVERRVHIQFYWYCRERRKDPDNLAASKKFVCDGLVKAGILKSDGWTAIASFSDRFFVDRERPRVEVVIEDFDEICYNSKNDS